MSVTPAPEPVEGPEAGDAVAEVRTTLSQAFKARAKAVKALEAARAATIRARALVGALAGELEKHVAAGKRVSAMRTEDLAKTLRAGKAPSFEVLAEIPAIEAKRLEAESRLMAAKAATADLERDESDAEAALAAAETAIKEGIKAVVRAHADELAESILDLQAKADDLHEKLGIFGSHGFVGSFLAPTGALAEAMRGQVWGFNGGPWKRSAAHQVKWAAFAKALEQDADAPLELD